MSDVDDAVRMAGVAAKEVVQEMVGMLKPAMTKPAPRFLTPKQQLERFLRMNHSQFEALKQRYGEESFNRYLTRMRQLAREV